MSTTLSVMNVNLLLTALTTENTPSKAVTFSVILSTTLSILCIVIVNFTVNTINATNKIAPNIYKITGKTSLAVTIIHPLRTLNLLN